MTASFDFDNNTYTVSNGTWSGENDGLVEALNDMTQFLILDYTPDIDLAIAEELSSVVGGNNVRSIPPVFDPGLIY